jgi:hypothetical protein
MEVTFTSEESNKIIMEGMKSEGFTDIDPKTLEVSVKSLRDGSGSNQITCSFSKVKVVANSTAATQPSKTETELVPETDGTKPSGDSDSDTSSQISDIFNPS